MQSELVKVDLCRSLQSSHHHIATRGKGWVPIF
jgi:hypothetical protein